MRIVFFTGSPRHYMAPPKFGVSQINVGPDWENTKDSSGRWQSFKTPVGCYPIQSILRQIPSEEQPDILVCLVDASRRNMPTGLSAFRGPKVLLVADTHHMQSPLSGMMAYAASEPFDRIAFLYDRHHIPFFQAAGFKNLFWLPGFTFPHGDRVLEKIANANRKNLVGFVGQTGKFHPRRTRLLQALQSGKIPVLQKVVLQSHSLDFYAGASVGFNASLNGDLNLRVFEILSSGAALLTDSLGLDSGLDVLANSGCCFETYSSPEELVDKAKNLLANPTRAAEIGMAGRNWFLEHLRNEKRCEIFQRVAFDGVEPELFKIPSPPSFKISLYGPDLPTAVEVYEFVQELHRVQEKVTVLKGEFSGDIDFFKSLPRVEIEEASDGKKGELLVTTLAGEESARLADGKHLWVVDAENNEPAWPQSQGYSRLPGKAALFERKFRPFAGTSATLEVAVSAFNAGRLAEAEDVCRELLQADEKCAGAWNLMARMAALNGDLDTAGDFGAVACELEPDNAGFVRFLAEVNLGRGELESAEALVRRALEVLPEDAASLALLGRVLCEKGEKADSLSAFQQALRLRKEDAEICAHYAQALQKMDRGKDAISQMRKAVSLAPESVEHRTSLGMLLEENKRYADALASYEKALELRDDVGFVWHRKGKLLNGLQRYAEGAEAMRRAIELPGASAEAHYDYGLALQMTKRVIEALEQYDRAASMGLDKHEMHCNRGVILKEINRHADAIQAFYRAVRLAPENEHYVNNLGAAALDIGLNSEALECFQDAVAANPNLQTAHNNIGNLLKDRGRGAEALPHYRRSMELAEGKFAASRLTKNNYLLCFQYLPEISPEAVFEEHKKWGMETVKLIRPAFNHTSRKIPAGEKLRVGFVSADFCQHPVGVFMEPLLRELAGGRFEIFAYADYKKADSVSERMRATVPNWRETGSMTDAELAKAIHEDGIDVLFELTGHTALNRLDMFALKPAPVQATYLGYPSTTGLPTIDFRLTDAEADPAGMTEKFHIERLVRIAECAWCFSPHVDTPEVGPLPALERGVVTFGCFNNMAKWNEPLYGLWLEILRRVPGSRLRLKARTLLDNEVRGELETWFVDRGIERERLDFSGHSRGIGNHLREYNKVDIALDSYPYHGTTTTCEALWMGCPVVTLEGKSHVSRVGVSLLKTVALSECIVKSREAYVEKAVALAGDLEKLATLRSGMRDRLLASPLMDSSGFARRFENAIDEMVRLKKGK